MSGTLLKLPAPEGLSTPKTTLLPTLHHYLHTTRIHPPYPLYLLSLPHTPIPPFPLLPPSPIYPSLRTCVSVLQV